MNKEDINIKNILQEQKMEAAENPWFTKKVLNRLPEKQRSYVWIEYVAYFIGGIICGLCWKNYITNFTFNAITVGELLKYIVLSGVTLALVTTFLYRTVVKD